MASMVQSKGNGSDKGRTVPPTMKTENGTENSPIDAYYSFPASNCKQEDTFSKRADAIATALGNKDSVKG
jgi:hypothetical protein